MKTRKELFVSCCSPYLALSTGAGGASFCASVPQVIRGKKWLGSGLIPGSREISHNLMKSGHGTSFHGHNKAHC